MALIAGSGFWPYWIWAAALLKIWISLAQNMMPTPDPNRRPGFCSVFAMDACDSENSAKKLIEKSSFQSNSISAASIMSTLRVFPNRVYYSLHFMSERHSDASFAFFKYSKSSACISFTSSYASLIVFVSTKTFGRFSTS